jgi:hypothetical protein
MIDKLAHQLIELQETSKRLLESDDIDNWLNSLGPQIRVADELRSYLLNHPVVVTDDPAVMEILIGIDLTDIENMDEIGSELLFSWISPSEYAVALAQVDILITSFQIPPNLKEFFNEARQCYALGQYSAVQSLSRTILEAAVNDIAVRTHKFPKEIIEQNTSRKYPIWKRIKQVAANHNDEIYKHYGDSNCGDSSYRNLVENNCKFCNRSYPMPSINWDSFGGQTYIYGRGSVPEKIFYEEFEARNPNYPHSEMADKILRGKKSKL